MDVRVVGALLAELLHVLGWQDKRVSVCCSPNRAAGSQKRAASEQNRAAASQKKQRK